MHANPIVNNTTGNQDANTSGLTSRLQCLSNGFITRVGDGHLCDRVSKALDYRSAASKNVSKDFLWDFPWGFSWDFAGDFPGDSPWDFPEDRTGQDGTGDSTEDRTGQDRGQGT